MLTFRSHWSKTALTLTHNKYKMSGHINTTLHSESYILLRKLALLNLCISMNAFKPSNVANSVFNFWTVRVYYCQSKRCIKCYSTKYLRNLENNFFEFVSNHNHSFHDYFWLCQSTFLNHKFQMNLSIQSVQNYFRNIYLAIVL